MKAYSSFSESAQSKSSNPSNTVPFFNPQRNTSNFLEVSENKESKYFFQKPDVIQLERTEFQPNNDDREYLKEVISALNILLKLEEAIVQKNMKGLMLFYESAKNLKSEELVGVFQEKYTKSPVILGRDYFMYKEDIEKIKKKISEEHWSVETTIKDAEDILELRSLVEFHNNYASHCFEDNPLTFSIPKEEIAEIIRTWKNNNSIFIRNYEGSNERVKSVFKIEYNDIKQEDVNLISEKLKSNRLKKDSKDKFDENLSKLSPDDQVEADPPLPDVSGIKYQSKNYSLFKKGKKDSNEIDSNDIKQGQLGNCYYLSAIASIAKINPDYFKGVIEKVQDKEHFYKITFFIQDPKEKKFKKYDVFVDNDVPVVDFSPYFAGKGDDELWVMLLEKALAKLFGGYKSIEAGSPEFAFGLLTGKNVEIIDLNKAKNEDLTAKLYEVANSKPIVFASKANATTPVLPNHAYYFESMSNGIINLGNPHGKDHLNNLSFIFIKANFESLYIGDTIK